MNSAVFEYNGYHFQPYAKYTAPIKVFDEFINYDTVDFKGTEFNRKDFYNQSPVKNCDVFYCIETDKLYIPQHKRLCEYDEPAVAQYCKAEMVSDYEIIHSFYVGERKVIVGEDKNAEYRYFCGYYEINDIFAGAVDCRMSNDYLEIMQIYCDRTKEQVELCKSQQIDGAEPITADMYNSCHSNDDLTNKVVVLKPEILRREYQNAANQLFYVTGGNGAKPNARGTKIYGYNFSEKKHCYIRRYDVMGVMENGNLPEWAKNNLSEIKVQIKHEDKEVR